MSALAQAIIVALISSSGIASIIVALIQKQDKKESETRQLSLSKLAAIESKVNVIDDAIKKHDRALISQLHTSIYRDCETILTEYAEGRRDCVDADEMRDLQIRYKSYHDDLGGDGMVEILFGKVVELPIRQTNRPWTIDTGPEA